MVMCELTNIGIFGDEFKHRSSTVGLNTKFDRRRFIAGCCIDRETHQTQLEFERCVVQGKSILFIYVNYSCI